MSEIPSNLASRWKRLGGALVDGLIATAIVFPVLWATGLFQQQAHGLPLTIHQQIAMLLFGWGVFLILNGYLLYKRGQTIGKVVVKTKIVDLNDELPSFGKLLVFRYFIFGIIAQVPIIGPLVSLINSLFIFGKERRCLHDYLANTRVVEA